MKTAISFIFFISIAGQPHHLLRVTPTNSSQSDTLQVKSPILVKHTDS